LSGHELLRLNDPSLVRRNRRVGALVVGGLVAASVAGALVAGLRERPERVPGYEAALREGHLRRALELFAMELEPAELLVVQLSAARSLRDPSRAAALLGPGCEAVRSSAPRGLVARCLSELGEHQAEAGDDAAMATWARAGAELERVRPGELTRFEAAMIRGRAAVAAGGSAEVIVEMEAVIATLTEPGWQRRDRADLGRVLALNLRALGRDAAAIAALRAACEDYAGSEGRDALGARRLARAQSELAALELR
jgi:hypothetical protein